MEKKIYAQPEIKVVELDGETILAGSGTGVNAQQLDFEEVNLDEDFE